MRRAIARLLFLALSAAETRAAAGRVVLVMPAPAGVAVLQRLDGGAVLELDDAAVLASRPPATILYFSREQYTAIAGAPAAARDVVLRRRRDTFAPQALNRSWSWLMEREREVLGASASGNPRAFDAALDRYVLAARGVAFSSAAQGAELRRRLDAFAEDVATAGLELASLEAAAPAPATDTVKGARRGQANLLAALLALPELAESSLRRVPPRVKIEHVYLITAAQAAAFPPADGEMGRPRARLPRGVLLPLSDEERARVPGARLVYFSPGDFTDEHDDLPAPLLAAAAESRMRSPRLAAAARHEVERIELSRLVAARSALAWLPQSSAAAHVVTEQIAAARQRLRVALAPAAAPEHIAAALRNLRADLAFFASLADAQHRDDLARRLRAWLAAVP